MQILKNYWFWVAVAVAGVVLIFMNNGIDDSPKEDELHFKMVIGASLTTFDPHLTVAMTDDKVFRNLFDSAFVYGPQGELSPSWIESYNISDNQLVYTFTMKDKLRWSDGAPFTAEDVVFSFKRVLTKETAAAYEMLMTPFIANAEAWREGQVGDDVLGIRLIDELTYEVTLETPASFFLDLMTHDIYFPLPKHIVENTSVAWSSPEKIVGNGPFMVERFVRNDRIEMVKNPYYYAKDEVAVDRLTIFFVEDATTAYNMFQNGEVDLVYDKVPRDVFASIKDHPTTIETVLYASYYYLLNVREEHESKIKDPLIREALTLAVDRETLVSKVAQTGKVATSFVPPSGMYTPPKMIHFDVNLARQKLTEAGYPNGVGFPTLTLVYNTDDLHKRVAEYVQQQWKDNLGIEVMLENMEWKTLLEKRIVGDYEIARGGWYADYYDPSSFFLILQTESGLNETGYNNEQFDALVDESLGVSARALRNGLFFQAEQLLLSDLPVIPLFFQTQIHLMDPKKWTNLALENPLSLYEVRFVQPVLSSS